MSETNDTTDKTLRGSTGSAPVAPAGSAAAPAARKPMSLTRTVESGHVRQSFSHGRSKPVVVEKKKTRKLSIPGADNDDAGAKPALSADGRPQSQTTGPGTGGRKGNQTG